MSRQRDRQPNLFRITLSHENAGWVRSELQRRGLAGISAAPSMIINEAIAVARAGTPRPAPPAVDADDSDMFAFVNVD